MILNEQDELPSGLALATGDTIQLVDRYESPSGRVMANIRAIEREGRWWGSCYAFVAEQYGYSCHDWPGLTSWPTRAAAIAAQARSLRTWIRVRLCAWQSPEDRRELEDLQRWAQALERSAAGGAAQ